MTAAAPPAAPGPPLACAPPAAPAAARSLTPVSRVLRLCLHALLLGLLALAAGRAVADAAPRAASV
ncbi:hypothetical protein ACWF7Q_09935, partial [Streptomyces sp. NPDC054987]